MIFKIAWRNIYRNKKRSLITITSVFAALLLIILMRALQFGFYDKLIETVVESYAGYVEIHADGFWDNQSLDNSMQVDQQLLDDIQSVEGVENIVQRLQTFSLISVGVPCAIIFPPLIPAPGPMSITWSAIRIASSSCSTTITVLPRSLNF